jgi:hypothetical protein
MEIPQDMLLTARRDRLDTLGGQSRNRTKIMASEGYEVGSFLLQNIGIVICSETFVEKYV